MKLFYHNLKLVLKSSVMYLLFILLIGQSFENAALTPELNFYFLPWSEERNETLVRLVEEAVRDSQNNFTLNNQSSDMLNTFDDSTQTIFIFAYGSLINKVSAAKTISAEALKTYQPAVTFGVKRIFNINFPYKARMLGEIKRCNDTAMLDVTETKNYNDVINGVLFKVRKVDLLQLLERERAYKLIAVPVALWDDVMDNTIQNPKIFKAYIFCASAEPKNAMVHLNNCINPIPHYAINMVEKGVEQYGKAYYSFWVNTTFLADQKTKFNEWKNNPSIDMWHSPLCREQRKAIAMYSSDAITKK